jgi:hypothetical protein
VTITGIENVTGLTARGVFTLRAFGPDDTVTQSAVAIGLELPLMTDCPRALP